MVALNSIGPFFRRYLPQLDAAKKDALIDGNHVLLHAS
jgi:hypothetical protein